MLGKLLSLTCTWSLIAAAQDVKWYSKKLAEEVYREVNDRFTDAHPWHRVIQVDEWSYRHWILPRNPHFDSVVLLIDSSKAVQREILDVVRLVAHRFDNASTDKGFEGEANSDTPTYFFYADVSTPGCDWIVSLHQLKHIPELLFFRAGEIGQTNGMHGVTSFNEWISKNAVTQWKFTETEFFKLLYSFCEVNAKSPCHIHVETSNRRHLVRDLISLIKSRLWLIPIILVVIPVFIYTMLYRHCWLLRLGAVSLYALNVTCLISAIANYTPLTIIPSEGFWLYTSGLLQRFYVELSKWHYVNENVIVSLMFCILSATLLALRQCAFWDCGMFPVLFISLGFIVTGWYTISLLRQKGVSFCVDWLAELSIPRGSIDVDRNFLF
ncbi:membrane protein, putative [Babesia bigemina]|uniref:Membrane protein, putative n=1 Tax=Babesia bigemina TaxID=5866 RepID=A0A061D312_BABBI|nr:membrane protein, putative [Babesia bigemina]CDR94487.1 membrane protein, putative [Babesia bigemina]|eukprot:XP_012766673.1 membrane protein, putative [Babesia bigemina]